MIQTILKQRLVSLVGKTQSILREAQVRFPAGPTVRVLNNRGENSFFSLASANG